MLRTPSIFGPQNSGFVPFSAGAPTEALVDVDPARQADRALDEADAAAQADAAEAIARAATPLSPSVGHEPRAAWAPASSARIRLVEALVVAAICAYFAVGFVRMLAGA
jgi:hypothetical protein